MADEERRIEEEEEEPIPAWQLFYDNIMLLFFFGVAIPTLVFTVWGLMEIVQVPDLPSYSP